jgi:hypothetical protein
MPSATVTNGISRHGVITLLREQRLLHLHKRWLAAGRGQLIKRWVLAEKSSPKCKTQDCLRIPLTEV